MKTYYVSAQVTLANGQQTFKVQADSEKEAIEKAMNSPDSEIQPDLCDVEVEGLDWEHAEVCDEEAKEQARLCSGYLEAHLQDDAEDEE